MTQGIGNIFLFKSVDLITRERYIYICEMIVNSIFQGENIQTKFELCLRRTIA